MFRLGLDFKMRDFEACCARRKNLTVQLNWHFLKIEYNGFFDNKEMKLNFE